MKTIEHDCWLEQDVCEEHLVAFCSVCSSCSKCKKKSCGCEDDDFPCCFCERHRIWYCWQCGGYRECCPKCIKLKVYSYFKDLPLCSCYNEKNVRIRGEPRFCQSHKSWYCSICSGLCPFCKKREVCPSCKRDTLNFCKTHGYFCLVCDEDCPECDEKSFEFTKTQYHDHCNKPMLYCQKHGVYYCSNCGDKCKDCQPHKCSMLTFCSFHDKFFCPECDKKCPNCKEEKRIWLREKKEIEEGFLYFDSLWKKFVKSFFNLRINWHRHKDITSYMFHLDRVLVEIRGKLEEEKEIWIDKAGCVHHVKKRPIALMKDKVNIIEIKSEGLRER